MFKFLTIILFFSVYSFTLTTRDSAEIFCPNSISVASISDILPLLGENVFSHSYYGEEQYHNRGISYIGDDFVGCGGSNSIMTIYENPRELGYQPIKYTPTQDNSFFSLTDGKYTNKVIFVDGYPCMPVGTNNHQTFVYDEDSKGYLDSSYDITWKVDFFLLEEIQYTEEAVKSLTNVCEKSPEIDYSGYLQSIIDNTSPISSISDSISSFFSNETSKEASMTSSATNFKKDYNSSDNTILNGFNDDLADTLDSSYTDSSNLIVVSGCSAPAPITATVLGKTYTFFDIANLGDDNIKLIRNIFLLSGYLAGFIVVFRTV